MVILQTCLNYLLIYNINNLNPIKFTINEWVSFYLTQMSLSKIRIGQENFLITSTAVYHLIRQSQWHISSIFLHLTDLRPSGHPKQNITSPFPLSFPKEYFNWSFQTCKILNKIWDYLLFLCVLELPNGREFSEVW